MRHLHCFVAITFLWIRPAHGQSPPPSSPPRRAARALAPAAFPDLPIAIRRDLERRQCVVPQPWNGPAHANVVHGAFTGARVDEWAILCSVRDTSSILVFRRNAERSVQLVDSLRRSSDEAWMQGIGDGRWGYSRLLGRRPRRLIRSWRHDDDGRSIPQPIDHDAIEEAFVGKSAIALYFAHGRWYRRSTGD